jgi:hypothetical protein
MTAATAPASGFQMSFSKDELSGAPPVPAGWYVLQLKGFEPKAAALKPGETVSSSVSLNPVLSIINHPEYEGRRVFTSLNTKMAFMWQDFVHATGLKMEEVQDADAGTEKAKYTLPGFFENSDTNPDPKTWKYIGPLLNKTLEVELAEIPAQTVDGKFYKARNEIRQYKCALPAGTCTEKHSTNLIRQS